MRILFVCKDNPFGLGGGNFATRAYLQALSDLCDGEIDVFISKGLKIDPSIRVRRYYETPARGWLSRLFTFFKGHLHRHVGAIRKRLNEPDSDYDTIVFNNSKTSTGLLDLAKKKRIKVVTIHHNAEWEFVRDNTPNPLIRAILLRCIRKAEQNSYLLGDYNLFLTHQDMDTFHRIYGKCQGVEGVIGAFEFKELPKWNEKPADVEHLVFAITGSLCTVQGVDSIRYFFDELYSVLPTGSSVIISGRQPTQEVIELCKQHNNVSLVANPEDMNRVINQADVYICPTRLGGGLKLRVMDALRLGIPVLTHECSARGYDDFAGKGIWAFKNQSSFRQNLVLLKEMIENCEINRQTIRTLYEDSFAYGAGLNRMKTLLILSSDV